MKSETSPEKSVVRITVATCPQLFTRTVSKKSNRMCTTCKNKLYSSTEKGVTIAKLRLTKLVATLRKYVHIQTTKMLITDQPLHLASLMSAFVVHRKESKLFERRHEKTNVLVSDLVQHKPGCTATEDG